MMEFDSYSQCSDDGAELSISENGEIYLLDYSYMEDPQPSFLEAKTVFLLIQKDVAVSRASRLQWLLDHLNTIVTPSQKLMESSNNLEVISAIPREQSLAIKCNRFLVTYRTEVKFLAQSYRFVYCLDMSPSHANIDTQKDEILFDEILNCFKISIEGLCREFSVPGCSTIFQPKLYLTVIVNTPFFLSPAQQVLVKGVQICLANLREILRYVEKQFHILEEKIADVCSTALDHLDFQGNENERLMGDLFDTPDTGKMYSKIPMVTPDVNFVNMLRYSMLAISLLPENSISHILVITDGVVAMPDSNIMESLLFQLHYDSIAISFLKVGSTFHPHAGAGCVSYTDLLYFFAYSTLGTCIENFTQLPRKPSSEMNIYHEFFLLWSFHNTNKYACSKICDSNSWTSSNETFCSHKMPSLLSKRQTEDNTSASIMLLLSRRIREGFTVDNIFYMNGNLEIKLILQWKSSIYVHYKLRSYWPAAKNITHFEVYISAPYEFLHDITCIMKKESKSLYRQAIIERFWMRLSQLSSGDLGLAQQLSSFQINKDWHTLPESVRNGIPVFILNNSNCSDAARLPLTPSDMSSLKFINMWQPICQMETNNWRKWFHVHKISLILQHDNPLPKYLHLANSSQRYQVVQCRQAATALYGFLAEWTSFILIDNHTYLKLIYKESDKPPMWFCIVRISSKFPCVVLNIGFTTGTPGNVRNEICEELKLEISGLKYQSNSQRVKENHCCVLVHKPLEKILIRYDRIPNNYSTVIFPDGTQPPNSSLYFPSPVTGTLFTTLSRYLFHKRWIWSATLPSNPRLTDLSIARILHTITRMRMKEGFSFAYSAPGIITMTLEVWMDPSGTCIVQYVLFPPHCANVSEELCSGSEEDNEQSTDLEAELQMVTEVWIEPQYGKVVPSNPRITYADNKHYFELADAIYMVDSQCIHTLLTMEHLNLMCQDPEDIEEHNLSGLCNQSSLLGSSRKSFSRRSSKNSYLDSPVPDKGTQWYPIISPRIEHIPFKFDPISILPLCQQTELLFSMFSTESKCSNDDGVDKANKLLLENVLEHLVLLHDHELELTKEDSDSFTQQILTRHGNKHPHVCPISGEVCYQVNSQQNDKKAVSQWRCFIKGVSSTHIILTFVAATLNDLKALLCRDSTNITILNQNIDRVDRPNSCESSYNDVPINSSSALCLPVYVFDAPLVRLVNVYVDKHEECSSSIQDVYEDHRFKINNFIQEEYVKLKSDEMFDTSTDIKDETIIEYTNLKQHCKTLVITHSKCFTISLFVALHMGIYVHSFDVQSAMDQCEESITEIDITEYITTICAHVKNNNGDKISVKDLNNAYPCSELKSLHSLIREKFLKKLSAIFRPIATSSEFYFYKNLKNFDAVEEHVEDSDDEASDNHSGIVEFKSEEISEFSEGPNLFQRLESGVSGFSDFVHSNDVSPLFLNLICTLKYNGTECTNTAVRVLPTCLGELIQHLEKPTKEIDRANLQVTLDMLCLTLPPDVQNIINNYSHQGLRTTSFSSDFQPSLVSEDTEVSFNTQISEPLNHLSETQKKSIFSLNEEIKWLLRDEICTALLDQDPVSTETLNYAMNHITEGVSRNANSCVQDVIKLNFVYATPQSHEKFVEEFANLKLPYSGYKLCKLEDLYYLAKDCMDLTSNESNAFMRDSLDQNTFIPLQTENSSNGFLNNTSESTPNETFNSTEEVGNAEQNIKEQISQQTDISSLNESALGSDGGYDEDVSEDFYDYDWLITLSNKRAHLPNFWLIMKVAQDEVKVYFHCRFMELSTIQVGIYLEVQRTMCEAVRNLCKRINQLLLLQTLYETKNCDPLLEPDDSNDICNSPISRNASFARLKSYDYIENNEDSDMMAYSASLSEASLNFKAGEFSCPVVWETPFILHPRLKTGPGKSGISRGILALKNILDKFSVSNRTNMFVYRDNQKNVFYLRLQENMYYSGTKSFLKTNEYETTTTVSRSPSIASLPFSQNKSLLTQSEQSIVSATSTDIRPRVRSFGERESRDGSHEDTLILKVHGITEAGSDVQLDLVQVLQNRLDDAVLEFLSIMLARNAMCPLTPEDVHFIQRPNKLPELIIRLTIQEFAFHFLESFIHYLKQNLLQFLNVPKYTDNRSHYHFKDYAKNSDRDVLTNDDNIFIYNQSQNPSSGSRGIACIALAFINNFCKETVLSGDTFNFSKIFESGTYETTVTSDIIDNNGDFPPFFLEFRLWKQGRVNIENLSDKLKLAVSQASWDIVTEYYLLRNPLCIESEKNIYDDIGTKPLNLNTEDLEFKKEIEFNCRFDMQCEIKIRVANVEKPKWEHCISKKKKRHAIQPTFKATRSITFDESFRQKELIKEKNRTQKSSVKLNAYETGETGILSVIYSKYLPEWLEFGYSMNTPSVKKHKVLLQSRHLPNIIVGELISILKDCPRAFRCIPIHSIRKKSDDIYVPFVASRLIHKYVILSRNMDHWHATVSVEDGSEVPDYITPQALKHTQKFIPEISKNKFIPRQKMLWISVENDCIVIYTYNWAKENIDKLYNSCSNLGLWLCVRSCFLNSVISQKLGLFHNQSLTRKLFMIPNNPYASLLGNVEAMISFPKDHSHKRVQLTYNLPATLEAFRDNFRVCKLSSTDPVVTFTSEMREMKTIEKRDREELKTLHAMYQSRTSTTSVPQIFLLLQNSRIVHYCHTPLLFLSRWRLKTASTRDHSLYPSQAIQVADKMVNEEKEMWHTELCYGFFSEYRHYMQTLGFMPLQIDNPHNKPGIWTKDKSSYNNVFYIQKTILGGILILSVEFSEPFFMTKLLAIECNRLQSISSRASINRFTLSFLDECDRVKNLMHLHSFTYDYHLRCIYNYICGNTGVNKICDGYNVHQFLDDFLKYYNKAPNFARNLVHTDTLTIEDLITEGKQLFDYLLSNVNQYDFQVIQMNSHEGESEYILVQVTSAPQVSYKDSQDQQHTDDFDITLVVHNVCTPFSPKDNVLHLRYYLILTSKREVYPKSEVDEKLGKFRTVSSTARSLSALEREPNEFAYNSEKNVHDSDILSSTEQQNFSIHTSNDTLNNDISFTTQQSNSLPYVEINQESVNYLGYYSSHEQLMQQLILDKASTTKKVIGEMVKKGMVHCRTHLLWSRLIYPQDFNGLSYDEFLELKNLARLEHVCQLQPNLRPLLNQPITWYQNLAKLLLARYMDQNRSFISTDGNIEHYVILHQDYFNAFMLLSLDLHTSRGEIYAVYREPQKYEDMEFSQSCRKALLDGFVNFICFYLWSGMISN
ncbi:KICSTOR complex protein SZT2-like isoform X1 [Diorhabda sublineata]|uniref:KICSTOR complex protein SZT2-like isoform X1 n=1 Tax=Diorhabda sublineata TaxID=1163346 RepID=UPI0024E050B4|nr:KICSTOR complex protein SZT2-like isoform X1 [Diorhabda sublineata]